MRKSKSVPRAEENIARFYRDLQAIISDVNQAIREDEDGLAELKLDQITEQLDGGIYRLSIEDKVQLGTSRVLVDFQVGDMLKEEGGYPILVLVPGGATVLDRLEYQDALKNYFAAMLTNPSSPIVVFLAFVRRNKPKRPER